MKEHDHHSVQKSGLNEDEQPLIEQLNTGLDKMDEWFPVYTPDLQWFERQFEAEKKKQRKKLLRDLAIFWLSGLTLLGVVFAVINAQPFAMLYIQLIGALALPFVFPNKRRKKVGSE